jgi:hypothetical protein
VLHQLDLGENTPFFARLYFIYFHHVRMFGFMLPLQQGPFTERAFRN